MRQGRNSIRSRFSLFTFALFFGVLLGLTWILDRGGFTQEVDQLLHDTWVRAYQRTPPDDVVIVGIDPASLEQLGRWPWSRDLQATVFAKLARSGVRAVALDLLYVEPDSFPGNDAALADAIRRLPVAILPVLTEGRSARSEFAEKLPIPAITQHAENIGHIFTPLDSDGIVRRVHLKSGFRSAHWSVMGLALAESLGVAPDELPGARLDEHLLGSQWIEDYQVLIPFYGSGGTFTQVSVTDLLTDRMEPGFLKDKIVLVGMTSTGLGDVLPTAVSAEDRPMPGVEIHANVFSAIRDGSLITAIDSNWNYLISAILLVTILLLYSQLAPLWALVSAIVLSLFPLVVSFVLYRNFGFWYAPLAATIPVMVSYFLWSWHRLDYAAEFLRRETNSLMEDASDVPDATDNGRLAEFFESASQLLPLAAWHFSASGMDFSGGGELDGSDNDLRLEQWTKSGSTYRKRYSTRGRLQIAFRLTDEHLAPQFMEYIDSLSRIKERQVTSRLSGSVERLQGHTYQLKFQLDRLRQLKALSDSIFSGSPAGLIVWNAAGELVTSNALASEMLPDLDVSAQSLVSFLRHINLDPDVRNREQIENLILNLEPLQLNRVDQDAELVINFNAIGDTLASRLVAASIVDVSEIRRSERSRAELIDFLSHDLRSPLISSLYLLKAEDTVRGEAPKEKIERIENNINLTLRMIDDLLSIARADNLTAEAFVPVLFDSIVDSAVDRLSPQARSADIQFEVDTRDDDLWLDGDAALLERAVVNIVSNAVKYSPSGTTIRVVTEQQGDHVVCRIIDQGIGIAPDMMKNLFKRFKRDAIVASAVEGIGLGLALVSKVVSQHGGTIEALNRGTEKPRIDAMGIPGEGEKNNPGTEIRMTLPLNAELTDEQSAVA